MLLSATNLAGEQDPIGDKHTQVTKGTVAEFCNFQVERGDPLGILMRDFQALFHLSWKLRMLSQ